MHRSLSYVHSGTCAEGSVFPEQELGDGCRQYEGGGAPEHLPGSGREWGLWV